MGEVFSAWLASLDWSTVLVGLLAFLGVVLQMRRSDKRFEQSLERDREKEAERHRADYRESLRAAWAEAFTSVSELSAEFTLVIDDTDRSGGVRRACHRAEASIVRAMALEQHDNAGAMLESYRFRVAQVRKAAVSGPNLAQARKDSERLSSEMRDYLMHHPTLKFERWAMKVAPASYMAIVQTTNDEDRESQPGD